MDLGTRYILPWSDSILEPRHETQPAHKESITSEIREARKVQFVWELDEIRKEGTHWPRAGSSFNSKITYKHSSKGVWQFKKAIQLLTN
ncbi:hypothetical protein OsI_18724 [Oryza sativa Indica Group]|uniref:Uncharacterized protein n=2 Tax=Oryza sativa TaxID=4530 RepID=B9FMU0_ORYSJ|nr:hypothetical protein OsI_18724 [Oryza sativa Indica Group]EEE62562.1 hypothetical protein OsJ_17361 [Oryza sativa Japonica Group]